MHPTHQMFEIGEIPCAGIALGVQGINRSKDAPAPLLLGEVGAPEARRVRVSLQAEPATVTRPRSIEASPYRVRDSRAASLSHREREICFRWGRDHKCLLAFDLNLVISKLEFSAAELPIPCDHHRFDFARLLRHIEVGSLNAIEPGQFHKFTAGSPTLHLSVGPTVRATVGTAAF